MTFNPIFGNRKVKFLLLSLLLVSLLPLLPPSHSQAAPTNLTLTNPSFESAVSGTTIPGWSQPFGTTGITVTTERAFAGTKSLKMVDGSTTASFGLESARTAIAPGKQVDTSAQFYVISGGSSVTLSLRFWDASNSVIHTETKAFSGSLNQWTEVASTYVAPVGTASVSVLLYSGLAGTTTSYFDHVTLTTPLITNLGTQVTNAQVSYSAFGQDSSGNPFLYVGSNGTTSKFSVFNAITGQFIRAIDLPGATAVWGMTVATDQSVYLATASGKIFRYIPNSTTITDLGVAIAGETTVWEITSGTDGKIYGGTYPGGKVFKYEPGVGFTAFGGQIEAGEQYVRSIAYDQSAHQLYLGIGSHAHLIKYDNNTGVKTNILPAAYASEDFAYYTNFVNNKIFVNMSPSGTTLVMNKTTLAVEKTLSGINSIGISKMSPIDDKVYYTKSGVLYSYDISSQTETLIANVGGNITGSTFINTNESGYPGLTFVAALRSGRILKYNLQTGTWSNSTLINVPELPTTLTTARIGPDGKIYTFGFLLGGMAIYNPATNTTVQVKGPGQAESVTSAGNILYSGVYPGAVIQSYNVTSSPSSTNPQTLFSLNSYGQDRPFGMLAVPSLNKLYVGTVPNYGHLGGVLAVYNTSTTALNVYSNVIPNQSIISLAYRNNEIFGGTSIWGGLGATPTTTEAKLFVWNTTTNTKVFEMVPVAGKKAITELINGPDGNIWGIAEGTLFVFNPTTRTIVYSGNLFPVTYTMAQNVWADAKMVLSSNGYIYVSVGTKLYRLNPNRKAIDLLVSGGGLKQLTYDNSGDLYYISGSNLVKFDQ